MDAEQPRKKRRGHGEGSGGRRSDGRWWWRITLPNGKRKAFYGKTQREARKKANDAIRDMEKGVDISLRSITVAAFLDRWLVDTAATRVRASTLASYRGHVEQHIVPAFGDVKLRALTVQQVNRLLADMVKAGKSPNTANRVRATLRTALASALRWGYVSQNVASLSDPRTAPRERVSPLTRDEVRTLLTQIRDHELGPLVHLAIATGCRQGELLALRWQDVDLEAGSIAIRFTLSPDFASKEVKAASTSQDTLRRRLTAPKTAESRRTVMLPKSAVEALRRQQAINERNELAAAHRWVNLDLVFPNTLGKPADASTVTKRVEDLIESYGLPRQRFHDLRHCAASLLLGAGADIFTVKEVLGHSQISLTANTYGHMTQALADDAAQRMNRALGSDPVTPKLIPKRRRVIPKPIPDAMAPNGTGQHESAENPRRIRTIRHAARQGEMGKHDE